MGFEDACMDMIHLKPREGHHSSSRRSTLSIVTCNHSAEEKLKNPPEPHGKKFGLASLAAAIGRQSDVPLPSPLESIIIGFMTIKASPLESTQQRMAML